MTAAEIFAEVATWPEGAKAPGVIHDGHNWVNANTDTWIDDDIAELAHIGSGVKWLLEHGVYLTAYKSAGRVVLTASGGDRAIDIGRFDATTPLAAVGKAVRSVKQ